MADFTACANIILEQAPHLKPEEAKVMAEEIGQNFLKEKGRGNNKSFNDLATEFILQTSKSNKTKSANKFRNDLKDFVNTSLWEKKYFASKMNIEDFFQNELVGSLGKGIGTRDSIAGQVLASYEIELAEVTRQFRKTGIDDLIHDPKILKEGLERDMAIEMYNLGQPEGFIPRLTGSKIAKQFAEIVDSRSNNLINVLNKLGSNIKKIPGYIVRNSHDISKLKKIGKEQWMKDVDGWVDQFTTYKNVTNKDAFLSQVYDNLRDGIHHYKAGTGSDSLYNSTGSLANKLSSTRLLQWKDGNAFYDYMVKYGPGEGGLVTGVYSGLEQMSKNAALMNRLGADPENFLKNFQRHILNNPEVRNAPKNAKVISKINPDIPRNKVENWFASISGKDAIPVGDGTVARFSAGLRIFTNISHLGFTTIRSFPDIALMALEASQQGIPILKSLANSIKTISSLNSAERKAIGEGIEVSLLSMSSDMLARMGSLDNLPGLLSKTQRLYFKANLLQWWTSSHRQGFQTMLANNLGNNAKLSFKNIHPKLQEKLKEYGINSREWDIIRINPQAFEGKTFITPSTVQDNVLKRKLQNYFIDSSDFAILFPRANERATMFGGFRPGDPIGEARRFFWHFKSFPLTVLTRPVGRMWKRGEYANLAMLISSMTVMGFASQMLIDVLKGRTPRDTTDPQAWIEASIKGGSLGLYGDALFGMFADEFKSRDLVSIAGPEFAEFADIMELMSQASRGDLKATRLLKKLMNMTPNLFYAKGAMDNLIWWPLIEEVDPGAKKKTERNFKKRTGQEFILP
jgi:hypothetical protein